MERHFCHIALGLKIVFYPEIVTTDVNYLKVTFINGYPF